MQGIVPRTARCAAAGAWLLASTPLCSQEPAQAIVVTGERLKQPLSSAPSSVAVYTAETIENLPGVDRLDQLLAYTPNVQLGSGGEGPTIRGQDSNGPLRDLPAFLGGNRPRVTLQVDGRPVSYFELAFGIADLWDVERIEVFRSPQTTTQGRNSIAGAIFVETAAPTVDWQARARLGLGDARTRQASAVVSGPIVDGALAFRLSGDVRRSLASSHITSTAIGVDYNRDAYDIVRLKLLATPPSAPGLRLTAILSHNRSSAPQVEGVIAPFTDRRDPNATYGVFTVRVDAATLRAEHDFASGWHASTTVTAGDATIRRLAPAGFGVAHIAGRDFSAEGLVTWKPRDGLTLLVGANRTGASLAQEIDLRSALLGQGEFRDRQSAFGLFGQGEWRPTPQATLTAGIRYQRDGQKRVGQLGIGNPVPLPLDYDEHFARVLPKLTASFELRPGVTVGAQVQRAYNPGGVTLDALRRITDTFDAETLWSYEGFVRLFQPSSSVSLSANVFYYDITNAQRTIQREIPSPAGVVTIAEIDNAPAARSSGAELQAQWRPSPRFTLAGSIGLLRTRLTETLSSVDPLLGKEFQRSPHFTGSLSATWRPIDAARVTLQARHNSGYFSEDTNDPARQIDGATVIDLGTSWSRGPLTLKAYARNLFDNFYLTYLYAPSSRRATAGDPREIGGSAELRF